MSGERTEPPTPQRRKEARREGQIPRSADLVAAAVLLVSGMLVAYHRQLAAALHTFASRSWAVDVTPTESVGGAVVAAATLLIPIVLVLAAAGIMASLAQTRGAWSRKALCLDFARLDPVAGTRRLFSLERFAVVGKVAVAMVAMVLCAPAFDEVTSAILRLPTSGVDSLGAVLEFGLHRGLMLGGVLLGAIGVVDYLLSRRRIEQQLKMTRQEVRDEHRRNEGDPAHKSARRQAHQEMARAPLQVKSARVVVVNPTHVAVALHHDPDMPVPLVGERGVGAAAARIRAEARLRRIPIVRDVPTARALLAIDPGGECPEPLFEAVAAILAAIYRHSSNQEAAP